MKMEIIANKIIFWRFKSNFNLNVVYWLHLRIIINGWSDIFSNLGSILLNILLLLNKVSLYFPLTVLQFHQKYLPLFSFPSTNENWCYNKKKDQYSCRNENPIIPSKPFRRWWRARRTRVLDVRIPLIPTYITGTFVAIWLSRKTVVISAIICVPHPITTFYLIKLKWTNYYSFLH